MPSNMFWHLDRFPFPTAPVSSRISCLAWSVALPTPTHTTEVVADACGETHKSAQRWARRPGFVNLDDNFVTKKTPRPLYRGQFPLHTHCHIVFCLGHDHCWPFSAHLRRIDWLLPRSDLASMPRNGSARAGTTDRNTRRPGAGPETDVEAARSISTILHYNSFPTYNAIQYETPSGYETIQYTAAGSKLRMRILGPDLLRGLLMMLMAMDHLALSMRAWEHGTGSVAENDGSVVKRWNYTTAYVVRLLTHLCAPGFMMLLGMGVVYLGTSRKQQGWSTWRLVRYFALRTLVLTAVMIVHSLVVTLGQFWMLNIVLFALAIDYFLAGMLWIGTNKSEELVTSGITRLLSRNETPREEDSDSDAEQPLLRAGQPLADDNETKAQMLSWHLHNVLLFIFSVVTIFWNIWLSPNHGQCASEKASDPDFYYSVLKGDEPEMGNLPWLTIWFWPTQAPGLMSAFPPLAWVSFAIVGVLYGRIMTTTPRSSLKLVRYAGASLAFAAIFVLTRLLHIGNLSEGCLKTPDARAHPKRNQYLVSVQAFLYIVKYPPDVAFWAFTLSANFALLAGLRSVPVSFAKKWMAMLLDFGTAALFFYVVHMGVVFGIGSAVVALFGWETGHGLPTDPKGAKGIDNMFAFFGTWTLCMLLMWPLCRWYGRFKATKPLDSLWRFF